MGEDPPPHSPFAFSPRNLDGSPHFWPLANHWNDICPFIHDSHHLATNWRFAQFEGACPVCSTAIGRDLLWPRPTLATVNFGHFVTGRERVGRAKEWARRGEEAKRWGPEKVWGPEGWRAQNSRFFFLLPLPFSFSSLSPLSGGLLVEFWWCFGRSGSQMCLFSPSGRREEAPGGFGAAGASHDNPRA